jgi:hypothetical protein
MEVCTRILNKTCGALRDREWLMLFARRLWDIFVKTIAAVTDNLKRAWQLAISIYH